MGLGSAMARSNRGATRARPAQDSRFSVPEQRSRHAATTRIALALALCLATLTIVIVASGIRGNDAGASAGIEELREKN